MIIDTHQHFWHVEDPWAKAPADYKILALPEGITGTIFRWPDTQFALDIAANEPLVVGVCGGIKNGPDFEEELERYSANPLFRGICAIGPDLENVDESGFLVRMEKLAEKDLQLDLLRVCPGFFGGPKAMQSLYKGTLKSLEGVFTIAERIPHLRMVVEHAGGMAIDGNEVSKEWEDIFLRMAEFPQIFVKVSGLMERATNRAEGERATDALSFYRPTLDALWRIFGEDRLLYGSNWPVSEHVGDFISHGLRIVRQYFAEKGEVASAKYFWRNSKAIYKWEARLPAQA
jgi:predicted TIM-barrel fold metal-dependent hydrolase